MSDREVDYDDIETRRRQSSSRRRMSPGRRLVYAIGMPILRLVVWTLHWTYRPQPMIGSEVVERILADPGRAYIPCYWHQQNLMCTVYLREWFARGFRASYIISASVDGEVPARMARLWGADVIRGSAANTGALVLRDAREKLHDGISIVATPDGPLGPAFEFKTGIVLMARIGNAPLVPIASAADRAWYLDTWDRFMIPKPFARTIFAVGQPVEVPPRASMEELEAIRSTMQERIEALIQESKRAVVEAT